MRNTPKWIREKVKIGFLIWVAGQACNSNHVSDHLCNISLSTLFITHIHSPDTLASKAQNVFLCGAKVCNSVLPLAVIPWDSAGILCLLTFLPRRLHRETLRFKVLFLFAGQTYSFGYKKLRTWSMVGFYFCCLVNYSFSTCFFLVIKVVSCLNNA